jgi:transposase
MTETIDSARRLIESRLRELKTESDRLEAALRSLDGGAPRSQRPRKAGRPKAAAKHTTKRAPRGQRRSQLLAVVKEHPGVTASQLASQIGISTNQAYALATRLHKEGLLSKRNRGYHVASSSAQSRPMKDATVKPRRSKRANTGKPSRTKARRKPSAP